MFTEMSVLTQSWFHQIRPLTPLSRRVRPKSSTQEHGIPIEDVKTLAKFRSAHNHIRVLEISRKSDHPYAWSRLLLLDDPGNIHSIANLNPNPDLNLFTDSYFDVFATLPQILPPGPVAILGFGAGSTARLILKLHPDRPVHGWELDPSVVSVGREFFGVDELEREYPERLFIHIGDAIEAFGKFGGNGFSGVLGNIGGNGFSGDFGKIGGNGFSGDFGENGFSGEIGGKGFCGFAGVFVDLFSKGCLIPELQEEGTWVRMREGLLRRGGRIMVNVGGRCVEPEDEWKDGGVIMEETLAAMSRVFGDDGVFVLSLGNGGDDSTVALTGGLPDLEVWREGLPKALRGYVDMWRPYGLTPEDLYHFIKKDQERQELKVWSDSC